MSRPSAQETSYFVMRDADYQLFGERGSRAPARHGRRTRNARLVPQACRRLPDFPDSSPAIQHRFPEGSEAGVTIGTALMKHSEIIVLDEPTSDVMS